MSDLLNVPGQPSFHSNSERENAALVYLAMILPLLPDYSTFVLHEQFDEYFKLKGYSLEEAKKVTEVHDMIQNLLIEEHLAKKTGTGYKMQLTEKGRRIKSKAI